MPDSTIGGLPNEATTINGEDLFVLEQNGTAKKLKGSVLTNYVTREILDVQVTGTVGYAQTPSCSYDAEDRELSLQLQRGPGISSIEKTGTEGKVDTYTITTEDNHTYTFTVTNGDGLVNSVAGIAPATGTFDVDKFALMNLIYPVGSIYQSLFDSESAVVYPGSNFGGVWERIEDVFLLAHGSTYATNAGTGGVAENTVNFGNGSAKFGFGDGSVVAMKSKEAQFVCDKLIRQPVESFSGDVSYSTELAGTQTLDNLPPYKIVNMWRRVLGTDYRDQEVGSNTMHDNIWNVNKYISTRSSSLGSPATSNRYRCIIISGVSEGDKFVICGAGASFGRLYAFLQSDRSSVLSANRAAANLTRYDGVVVTAPANAAYLVVNVNANGDAPWAVGKIASAS